MKIIKVFCPICGFKTELDITNLKINDNEYDSFNEGCTFCNDGIYKEYKKEIFYNNLTGCFEPKN